MYANGSIVTEAMVADNPAQKIPQLFIRGTTVTASIKNVENVILATMSWRFKAKRAIMAGTVSARVKPKIANI